MTIDELKALLETYTAEVFGGHAVSEVDVQAGEDGEGQPVLFVAIVLRPDVVIAATPARVKYRLDVRDLLEGRGETRFPVISFVQEGEYERRASA